MAVATDPLVGASATGDFDGDLQVDDGPPCAGLLP